MSIFLPVKIHTFACSQVILWRPKPWRGLGRGPLKPKSAVSTKCRRNLFLTSVHKIQIYHLLYPLKDTLLRGTLGGFSPISKDTTCIQPYKTIQKEHCQSEGCGGILSRAARDRDSPNATDRYHPISLSYNNIQYHPKGMRKWHH